MHAENRRQHGFTLVELVMVIVIVGVLAVYAAPRFSTGFDAAAARDELVEALRFAQQQSMSNTGANNFDVLLAADGFTVRQGGVAANDPGGGLYTRTWTGITVAPAGTTIAYSGRGGTAAQVVITLQRGTETHTVTVENQTGYVH